jgi:hypothetical protein
VHCCSTPLTVSTLHGCAAVRLDAAGQGSCPRRWHTEVHRAAEAGAARYRRRHDAAAALGGYRGAGACGLAGIGVRVAVGTTHRHSNLQAVSHVGIGPTPYWHEAQGIQGDIKQNSIGHTPGRALRSGSNKASTRHSAHAGASFWRLCKLCAPAAGRCRVSARRGHLQAMDICRPSHDADITALQLVQIHQ